MIVWDEAKRHANLAKHGLDFADAHLVYENPEKVTFSSHRNAEGRKLDIAMVQLSGRTLTLVYTERGFDIRVISFRFASRLERRAYEKARAEKSN
ncbi:BrnT family toxin [Alloacidobacterium sp.]|uniref:BrnT family toxin n=1 Tax=Alloacidobacterium sp. TaxID=2951999 RepID=UPI002D5B1585|nr:BrnT family toxin [Alloacidobacterium sp.]HYK37000.1 BrnT family toxin [Alloacidobacterium sp.]